MAHIIPGGECFGPGHGTHRVKESIMRLIMPNGEEAWLTKDHLWEWFEREWPSGDLSPPNSGTCPSCGRDYGNISCDVCHDCSDGDHDYCHNDCASECQNCGNTYPESCDSCRDPRECIDCGETMWCSKCDVNDPNYPGLTSPAVMASAVVDGRLQYEDGVTIQLLED